MTTSLAWPLSPVRAVRNRVRAVRGLDGGAQLVEGGDAEHPAVAVHADRLAGRGQHGGVERGAQRVGADGERVPERLGRGLAERGVARQRGEPARVRPAPRGAGLRVGDEDPRLMPRSKPTKPAT
jgi:hypothetical protein